VDQCSGLLEAVSGAKVSDALAQMQLEEGRPLRPRATSRPVLLGEEEDSQLSGFVEDHRVHLRTLLAEASHLSLRSFLFLHTANRCPLVPVCMLKRVQRNKSRSRGGSNVIILGIILLIIGFVASIPILWTIGIILVVIGVAFELLGMAGRAVGGRRHYY